MTSYREPGYPKHCRNHPDRPVSGPRTPWCVECENKARQERRAACVRGPVENMVKGSAGRERERREIEAMNLNIMASQAQRLRKARENGRNGVG